jgi:hypothetical protein
MRSFSNPTKWFLVLGFAIAPFIARAEQKPPADRVPIEAARDVATKAYQGKIQGEELEFEGGKWIYSFDLKSKGDKRVHEVHVDALSGKLLDIHTETASDEAKEKSEDAKEN